MSGRACTGRPAFCAGKLRSPVRNRENALKMGMNHLKWYTKEIGLQFHGGNGPHEMTTMKALI